MTAEVFVRELQKPIASGDSELMPPPPSPFERSTSGSPASTSSSGSSRTPWTTAAHRASAAADLESVFNILVDMMHFHPQWGKG